MKYAIAVLDIGKTNKKVVIYDEKLNQIDSVYQSIPSIPYEELEVENVVEIEDWFYKNLKLMSAKYDIRTLSISTHGATCACIDKEGELSVPVTAYTNEVEDLFHDEFYDIVGNPGFLQKETGTAQVNPLSNLAKLIFFLKKRFPRKFEDTEHILMYPQYFGYKLTGQIAADYTFLGCHTYLWDFKKWQWSSVTDKLGIKSKLPDIVKNPGDILGTISKEIALKTGLREDSIVTVGVHDSNSSLIPYLVHGEENLVLNSTGTWCVVMHPTKEYAITEDEVGKTVFYNISAREDLVKTAIFMGGLEFETYMDKIKDLNKRSDYPDFNRELMQTVLDKNSDYIIPGIMKGAGQFPDSIPMIVEGEFIYSYDDFEKSNYPEFFLNYEYAYAVLNLSLAIQTRVALNRVTAPKGAPIYIEGGFRKNDVYIRLLASMFPDSPVYTTNISEATSFGAALLSKSAYENTELDDLKDYVDIEMNLVEPVRLKNIDVYVNEFLKRV